MGGIEPSPLRASICRTASSLAKRLERIIDYFYHPHDGLLPAAVQGHAVEGPAGITGAPR